MPNVISSRTTSRIHPLKSLKEQVMALDAAMLVAVTSCEVGAVHKLRTTTRRVESQLTLLDVLCTGPTPLALPDHRKQAAAVRQRLRKVRRAAGAVRDLDVQSQVIQYDAPAKTEVQKDTPGDEVRKQAKQLRKHLQKQRDVEAEKLVAVLQAEEQKLAASLRALEQVLKPANTRTISQAALVERIEHWFAAATRPMLHSKRPAHDKSKTQQEQLLHRIATVDEDALHDMRKAAKLCRYMGEIAPQGSAAHRMAQTFEQIQEAGGRWHDWLLLQQLSAGYQGKKAALTQRYRMHTQAALADYHLRLAEQLPAVAEPVRSKKAKTNL